MEGQTANEFLAERHPSPPLLLLAIVHVALFIAGVLAVTVISGDRYPSPFEPIADAQHFFSRHARAAQVAGFCQFASAIPLGLFAAVAASRLRFLGVRAAGESIAFYGGVGAAFMLLISGICTWAAAGIADVAAVEPTLRGLQLVGFLAGGPGFVALFGLLIAGISVTTGFLRLLPSWLVGLGLTTAVLAELSTLTLLLPAFAYLLPVARVLGCIWLIAAGALLPTTRGALPKRSETGALPDPAHQPV